MGSRRSNTYGGRPYGRSLVPAHPGSVGDTDAIIYDIRDQLAPEEGVKIPDEDNPWHYCDCYRDLPLDTVRGPYPVIIFAHGTAGFRHQSLAQMTHWASHGFVVAAVDHPGLKLGDLLAFSFDQDLTADLNTLYAALENLEGDWAFLEGFIDLQRLGAAGHSAGGGHWCPFRSCTGSDSHGFSWHI